MLDNSLHYMLENYKADLDKKGLKETWQDILDYRLNHTDRDVSDILQTNNFGYLYEIGLAYTNKISKKEMGKYYTPEDVALLLSDYFSDLKGYNVCDVCCGVGNLILAYLHFIGNSKAKELIMSDHVYLYDFDEVAMTICKYSIALEFGIECLKHIHCIHGDFLSKTITLPSNCKVISNPPYYKITELGKDWVLTDIIRDSKDYYSAFMEKIITNSLASVIITPFSFIGSDKFYSLRKLLNDYNGMIFSFDNVPANIFNGKKQGIFNSNSSNSVRAAITIVENKDKIKGFRVSPLIRFSTAERQSLLNRKTLSTLIADKYFTVSKQNTKYPKCFKNLLGIYDIWTSIADSTFEDLISSEKTEYKLDVPTTCRYYLSATKKELDREGKITLYFKDKLSYEYAYCLLNSSFAYWHWRLFDGGITYPVGLLKTIPIKIKSLTECEYQQLHSLVEEVQKHELDFLVYKKNASNMQENVKFPIEYRDKFNALLLNTFSIKESVRVFDCVHSNKIFQR